MKLTREIVEKRLPLFKADALFGGQVSAWIQGEPIPRKFKSRLEQMFRGWKMDEANEESAESNPIASPKKEPAKPKSRKRRK